MDESNALVLMFLAAIAAPATLAFSSRSWYCHRLATRFITASVTPCRYPCLVVSPHVHPHIIVQNEADGTPCMIQNGWHHEGKIGICRNSFCVNELPHKVLKRKKRFICIYALARIIKLKKERRRLEGEIGQLRQQLANNREGDADNVLAGRVSGNGIGGADDLGGGSANLGAGPYYGPESVPSVGRGTGNSGLAGRVSAGPEMGVAGPFDSESNPTSRGELGTADVPFNSNYGGGLIGNGDDRAEGTAQVRLRDGGNMGGTSDSDHGGFLGSAAERGGGGAAAYFG